MHYVSSQPDTPFKFHLVHIVLTSSVLTHTVHNYKVEFIYFILFTNRGKSWPDFCNDCGHKSSQLDRVPNSVVDLLNQDL